MAKTRWTVSQISDLPYNELEDYEVIEGELFVSTKPHWNHQRTGVNILLLIGNWNNQTNAGQFNSEFGIIFDDDNGVGPDVAWVSNERFATAYGNDGKLHSAPELLVEILSPGTNNIYRDRVAKLNLYSNHNVLEYWIVDWHTRQVEIYRRVQDTAPLTLVTTLQEQDTLSSPVLAGFSCLVADFFSGLTTT
jgi:Uma2 family endonuclease